MVDYAATSIRPEWADLPVAVRDAVGAALGSAVVAAEPSARSGFTRGFAAAVTLVDGRRVFVKAASEQLPYAYSGYQREAKVVPQLPAAVRVPRIVASTHAEADGAAWFAVASELVIGRMPGNPWTADDLAITTATCEAMAEALDPSPIDGLGLLTDFFPAAVLDVLDRVPPGLQPWLPDRLAELRELADRSPAALTGEAANHADIRADNLLIDTAGTCWTLDWNWLCLGPVWADWVGLLPAAHEHGIDTDALLARSPLTVGVSPDDLDSYAAVLAAYMIRQFEQPIPGGGPMPAVRRHQRLSAWQLLDWIAARRGW